MKRSSVFRFDPGVPGGAIVFIGTQAPLLALLSYIEDGSTLDEFPDHYPSVTREHVVRAPDEV